MTARSSKAVQVGLPWLMTGNGEEESEREVVASQSKCPQHLHASSREAPLPTSCTVLPHSPDLQPKTPPTTTKKTTTTVDCNCKDHEPQSMRHVGHKPHIQLLTKERWPVKECLAGCQSFAVRFAFSDPMPQNKHEILKVQATLWA